LGGKNGKYPGEYPGKYPVNTRYLPGNLSRYLPENFDRKLKQIPKVFGYFGYLILPQGFCYNPRCTTVLFGISDNADRQ